MCPRNFHYPIMILIMSVIYVVVHMLSTLFFRATFLLPFFQYVYPKRQQSLYDSKQTCLFFLCSYIFRIALLLVIYSYYLYLDFFIMCARIFNRPVIDSKHKCSFFLCSYVLSIVP